MIRPATVLLGLALVAVTAFAVARGVRREEAWTWDLPPGVPAPVIPADNPMTAAKVALGRVLFYDRRLSANGAQSCATCHDARRAFTDGRARAVGSTGEPHRHGAMPLVNVAYAARLGWANPLIDRLEDQALIPMFGDRPVELGLPDAAFLEARLRADTALAKEFARGFPDEREPVTVRNVTRALASFERTLLSFDSPYDRFARGDARALTPSAIRGLALFQSERLECFHCHGGFTFSDSVSHVALPEPERAFHDDGLYEADAYPAGDRGLIEVTGRFDDVGRFKAPTLRNVAVTAPYMHDGSIATLEGVLDHYARGGSGTHADPLIAGFALDDQERADVVAFLTALTDDRFVTDPRFAPPDESDAP
jgi:cytochrome c peroxidase